MAASFLLIFCNGKNSIMTHFCPILCKIIFQRIGFTLKELVLVNSIKLSNRLLNGMQAEIVGI